jgi:hypothetical protein
MGKTPMVALASVFLAGLGLTGCESCSLFGANRPWRQDQAAASSTPGTSGWQNQPKTATAGSPDVSKTTTLGQSTNPDAGFGRSPASGFLGLSPTPNTTLGQNATGSASGNAFAPNSTAPTGNANSSLQTSAPSPSGGFSNNMPYGARPSGDSSMGVSRTTFPQTSTPPDWNRDPNAGASQLSASSGDRATAFPGTGPSSSATAPAPSGLQTSSFPGQSSGVSNSQYQNQNQTQYPNSPSTEGVKTMPPPGQGDQ